MRNRCIYCRSEGEAFVPNLGGWVCREHFMRYFYKRVSRVLRRLGRGRSVLVGVSGGKDSVAALYATADLSERYSLRVAGLMIDMGLNPECLEVYSEALEDLGVEGYLIRLEDLGMRIPRDPRAACLVCGTVTRYLLNRAARELGFEYAATGHNLDDMAYFAINNLITHNVWYLRYLDSVTPPVPGAKTVGRVRPLFWVGDSDSANFVRLRGARSCVTKCPHEGVDKQAVIKPLVARLVELWPQSEVNLVGSLRELARRAGLTADGGGDFRFCSRCGYPSRTEVCSFCRLAESMGGSVPERLPVVRVG